MGNQMQFSAGATKNGWSARVTRLGPDSLLAVLNVPPATPDFVGNYSCGPPSLQLASITLHVLNGTQYTNIYSQLPCPWPAACRYWRIACGIAKHQAGPSALSLSFFFFRIGLIGLSFPFSLSPPSVCFVAGARFARCSGRTNLTATRLSNTAENVRLGSYTYKHNQ